MNEEHVKKILLSLVEPNRKLGRDVVSSSVTGWRFRDVDEEQHRQPGRYESETIRGGGGAID